MSTIDEQWSLFFNEAYFPLYAPFLPPEKATQEVEYLVDLLHLSASSSVLDLGCGYGRHALLLATYGYRVVGLDASERLLHLAQQEAEAQGVRVRWVHGDMRAIPFENEFDAVLNLFSSFGYFEQEEENLCVLQQVHKALKPHGLFLLDTLSQVRLVQNFLPYSITRYDDGLIVLEERRFDLLSSRYEVGVTLLHPDGRRSEYEHSLRVYTLTELTQMLASAGLLIQACYGNLDGSPFTMESRLVLVSRKKP